MIITPVFGVTWSFRNNYDMLICCSRNINIQEALSMLKTGVRFHIFVETDYFYPKILGIKK